MVAKKTKICSANVLIFLLLSVIKYAKLAKKLPERGIKMTSLVQTDFSLLREKVGISLEDLSDKLGFSLRTLYRWERGESRPRKVALDALKLLADSDHNLTPESPRFEFIDLFAGIGGLRRGFEPLGGKCVFTSEWDRFSQLTYKANYNCDHEISGDITEIPADAIPGHDVLLAGFPCQPFSIAGVSKKNALNRPHGFRCEAQGTLFFDVARIIERHRPRAFLLENVKNLASHNRGQTFQVIHRTLTEELGYDVHWKVINARSWVPQHRERIFIVGFREPNDFSFEDLVVPNPVGEISLGEILHPCDGSESPEKPYTEGEKARVSPKYTLSDHLWNYLQQYREKHRKKGNGFGFGLVGSRDISRTLSARYHKDGSEILVRQNRKNPRRLTPRECARLMGFDLPGECSFVIPVSDTQAYRQFGNAVVPPVVESVARLILPWIGVQEMDSEDFLQRRLPLFG